MYTLSALDFECHGNVSGMDSSLDQYGHVDEFVTNIVCYLTALYMTYSPLRSHVYFLNLNPVE
jgi:hypothetical protein